MIEIRVDRIEGIRSISRSVAAKGSYFVSVDMVIVGYEHLGPKVRLQQKSVSVVPRSGGGARALRCKIRSTKAFLLSD